MLSTVLRTPAKPRALDAARRPRYDGLVSRKTALAVAVLCGTPQAAWSQPADASALVEEGKRLAKAGQLADALDRFQRARRAAPGAEHDCLLALAYRRLDRLAEAHRFIDDASRDGGAPPRWCAEDLRREVEGALRGGTFAPVELGVSPSGALVSVSAFADEDPIKVGATPRTIWVPLGVWELTASADGHRAERLTLKVQTTAPQPVRIALERATRAPAAVAALRPAPETEPVRGDASVSVDLWPWVALGGGAASTLAGVFFHTQAASTRGDAERLPPGMDFNERASTFDRQRVGAIAGYTIGAAALALGLWLLLRDRPSHPATAAR